MKTFPRFSLNFARDKDLPADFDYFFLFLYSSVYSISVFQFFSSLKKYEYFLTVLPQYVCHIG